MDSVSAQSPLKCTLPFKKLLKEGFFLLNLKAYYLIVAMYDN